jgi:hypothetical protein
MSKSSQKKRAQLIFEKWSSELRERDRSKDKVTDNFDDLFFEFSRNGIDFDTAHEFLDQAIAMHLPRKDVVRNTYKRLKHLGHTEQEFFENWKALIKDKATNVFYARYPLDTGKEKKETTLPNGMSKEEYLRQRRYASSFPILDLSKIPDIPDDDGLTMDDVSFTLKDLEGSDG